MGGISLFPSGKDSPSVKNLNIGIEHFPLAENTGLLWKSTTSKNSLCPEGTHSPSLMVKDNGPRHSCHRRIRAKKQDRGPVYQRHLTGQARLIRQGHQELTWTCSSVLGQTDRTGKASRQRSLPGIRELSCFVWTDRTHQQRQGDGRWHIGVTECLFPQSAFLWLQIPSHHSPVV